MPPKTRVLIVEDDALLAMAMEQAVEDLGYEVVGPSQTLHDGLDRAQRADLDFALLDYDLGHGTDAIPIAEALTRLGIPYVFTTGTSAKTIRDRVPSARVLIKPVTALALARAMG